MVIIGEAVVERSVFEAAFSCDLEACKGACCWLEGGRGAPLADGEITELEDAFPAVQQYLSERSRDTIARKGLYEGTPGDYATTCIDNRECVFALFENGIARCSFERAYRAGEIRFPKPLSCHLFPIRVRKNTPAPGQHRVQYEQIEECAPGRRKGARTHQALLAFLEEPLIRAYGNEWYRSMCHAAKSGHEDDMRI
jgi:hypothetical protein